VNEDSNSNFTTAAQNISIQLGNHRTWRLSVDITSNTSDDFYVSLAAKSTDGPTKGLDISSNSYANGYDCQSTSNGKCEHNASLSSQLVAGQYYLVVGGQAMPVNITVLAGSSGSASNSNATSPSIGSANSPTTGPSCITSPGLNPTDLCASHG
jgi:hypothetical protein